MRYKPLPFLKLPSSLSTNETFLDMSSDALRLWTMAVSYAGHALNDGVFADNPRKMARFSGLMPDEVKAARKELIDAGLWAVDDGNIEIVGWFSEMEQATADSWREQQDQGRFNAHKKWHVGRSEKKLGCQFCYPQGAPEEATEDEDLTGEPNGEVDAISNTTPNTTNSSPAAPAEDVKVSSYSDLRDLVLGRYRKMAPNYPGVELKSLVPVILDVAKKQAAKYEETLAANKEETLVGEIACETAKFAWGEEEAKPHYKTLKLKVKPDPLAGIIGIVEAQATDPENRIGQVHNAALGKKKEAAV